MKIIRSGEKSVVEEVLGQTVESVIESFDG
jgi:hypothetical protein